MQEPKAATTSERNPLRGHRSEDTYQPNLQLALGTFSFTVCFAAWGLISAFAPRIPNSPNWKMAPQETISFTRQSAGVYKTGHVGGQNGDPG
jgi:hypothetical protein